MKKTNAARILERYSVEYELLEYVVDEADLSAEDAAHKMNVPVEQVFKTLVARGDKTGVLIVSIPGNKELDLKALAKLSGNKKVEMVPSKEIQPLTGYIRGAVSPLGLKSKYPYYLDRSAYDFSKIVVSAGTRGVQIGVSPDQLVSILDAATGKLVR